MFPIMTHVSKKGDVSAVSSAANRLREILAEAFEIARAISLLTWDQQTHMPQGGVEARAKTRATLERLLHESFTRDEVGSLLVELEREVGDTSADTDLARLVRATRRAYDQRCKLPSRLVEALSKATALGMHAWERAREADDFLQFQPHLEEIVALQIEKAHALGFESDPYDALLDLFEPEMKSESVDRLFADLKKELVPLAQAIFDRSDRVDDSILRLGYDADRQWAFTLRVIEKLGFDMKRGRQDRSAHPFTMGVAPTDVRLTTRIDEHNLASGLYASIHEAGHGMYEQGLPMQHYNTPLCDAISLGIHESQSRLWENVVGRSRAFWRHFFPFLKELFPAQLQEADVETVYRAVNRVEATAIRVEADEVTYNLHIFLRYELERELIRGSLSVAELPEAWREKTKAYLGFEPKSDREGVLQDIHWSDGYFGYFPTYTLGSVLSVQLYQEAVEAHPAIPAEMEQGNFATLLSWLQRNIYAHGARYTPSELVQKATGGPIAAAPYLTYLREKYQEIYNL